VFARWYALLFLGVLAAACAGVADEPSVGTAGVAMVDDEFSSSSIRVPFGGIVVWRHQGTNPHDVIAADRTWSSATPLRRGDSYQRTFDHPGVYPYFCSFHGDASGGGMSGYVLVGDEAELPVAAEAPPARSEASGTVLRVPADHETIQAAVDAATPGDLVLVAPGVYRESVRVTTPSLVIRGEDRNETILDGGFELIHGIQVLDVDGVAVENLTTRNYLVNGVYWTGVAGYRGSYLTAHNNGDYGVYAYDSTDGVIEDSYASGNVDSGFYIGQCYPCRAIVRRVLSEGNALGFSGTNAGGDLYLIDSVWRDNMSGVVPNSLDSELEPPHRETTIVGNLVMDNNNRDAPTKDFGRIAFGTGIVLAGGVGDVVERNLVLNHDRIGILATMFVDRSIYFSQRAVVRDNVVTGSGWADVALVGPWGPGNCFDDSDFLTTQPPLLQTAHSCAGLRLPLQADTSGVMLLAGTLALANRSDFGGDFQEYPAPEPQTPMAQPLTAPAVPAIGAYQPPDLELSTVPSIPEAFQPADREVMMSGIPISEPTFWQLVFPLYGYFLPIALYAAWLGLAIWDLARRKATRGFVIGWLAVILLVPFLGVIAYLLFGRSRMIPAWFRFTVVGGGIAAYLLVLGASAVVGGLV
jgi:plastocyanin